MKVLVIDHEEMTVKKVKELLSRIDASIRVVGVTNNLNDTTHWLNQNNKPDIILANENILSKGFPGIRRDVKALVTFSTNLEEYNYQALRYKTLSHLLKDENATGKSYQGKYAELKSFDKALAPEPYKQRFLVKQGQRLLSVPINHIAYFFSQERFIFFKTFDNQKLLLEHRIEHLETILSPHQFFRINRSFIISLNAVKEIHSYFGNRLKLYLHPSAGKEIIVSRKRVSDFKDWLGK